jgi:hypothetical protein
MLPFLYQHRNEAMRKRIIYLAVLFILVVSEKTNAQLRIGFHAGASVNFLTVNSLWQKFGWEQYLGFGYKYKPGLSFCTGISSDYKMSPRISMEAEAQYMLKRNRVFIGSTFKYNLNFHNLRLPLYLKLSKQKMYWQLGLCNNFLFLYNKDDLYRTLDVKGIYKENSFILSFIMGFGVPVGKRFDLYLNTENDISPFLLTRTYERDILFPFKFHNITLGVKFWPFQSSQKEKKTL